MKGKKNNKGYNRYIIPIILVILVATLIVAFEFNNIVNIAGKNFAMLMG